MPQNRRAGIFVFGLMTPKNLVRIYISTPKRTAKINENTTIHAAPSTLGPPKTPDLGKSFIHGFESQTAVLTQLGGALRAANHIAARFLNRNALTRKVRIAFFLHLGNICRAHCFTAIRAEALLFADGLRWVYRVWTAPCCVHSPHIDDASGTAIVCRLCRDRAEIRPYFAPRCQIVSDALALFAGGIGCVVFLMHKTVGYDVKAP